MISAEQLEVAFPIITFFIFVIGACIGSFLNVVAWRLPRRESLSTPPSHCPKCNKPIRPWENIPLVSWLFLRGRCRQCGQAISIRYPLVEMITAILFVIVWSRVYAAGMPLPVLLPYLYLTAILIAITIIDFEHMLIPDKLTLPAIAVALLLAGLMPDTRGGTAALGWDAPLLLQIIFSHLPAGLANSERVRALLDVLFGATLGWLLLWSVLEVGKKILGYHTYRSEQPVPLKLTAEKLVIGQAFDRSVEHLFGRRTDRFRAPAHNIRLTRRPLKQDQMLNTTEPLEEEVLADGELVIGPYLVVAGQHRVPFRELTQLTAQVTEWRVPREVMGLGDVKLLAVIGAFLGVEALFTVILLSAVTGCFGGLLMLLFQNNRKDSHIIPYGPFLALAAVIWMLCGIEITRWYSSF